MAQVMRLRFRMALPPIIPFDGFIDDDAATQFIDDDAAIQFIDDSGTTG